VNGAPWRRGSMTIRDGYFVAGHVRLFCIQPGADMMKRHLVSDRGENNYAEISPNAREARILNARYSCSL
jgi:hypothetical protein